MKAGQRREGDKQGGGTEDIERWERVGERHNVKNERKEQWKEGEWREGHGERVNQTLIFTQGRFPKNMLAECPSKVLATWVTHKQAGRQLQRQADSRRKKHSSKQAIERSKGK